MMTTLLTLAILLPISAWGLVFLCAANAYRREHGKNCWFCGKTYPCDCAHPR
jgi:hypothetical protein